MIFSLKQYIWDIWLDNHYLFLWCNSFIVINEIQGISRNDIRNIQTNLLRTGDPLNEA